MASLTVIDGPNAGHNYELKVGENTLGRHPECNVVIDVGAVSRRHAQVIGETDAWYVKDLGSRNGTFVNEERVEGSLPLCHGDRLRVCDVEFSFQSDDDAPLPPPQSSAKTSDSSTLGTIFLDDAPDATSSTIMSQVDVTSNRGQVQLSASPEAKLAALVAITQALGNAVSLDEVLPTVLESLFKIFVQADRAFIGLTDRDGVLIPRWTKARREDEEETIRVSRTIVNHVLQSRQAVLSADALDDSRFSMAQSIADFRIRSMMCAPLMDSDGEPMGVLHVDTLDQRHRFKDEDLELLISAAAQAGVAIQNAQLHEAAMRQQATEQDIKTASSVQMAFLPEARPSLDGYEFYHFYEPANHIGGDYFDYIRLPDGRTAVIVADVVGHGVAAALLMAKLAAEARFLLASEARPDTAITKLNNELSRLSIDRFVTLVAVILDAENHRATIVNAGHMAPIHRRADGRLEEPGEDLAGLPLGIVEGVEYDQLTIDLEPGESLTMYTDGINEAMDQNDVCFSIERIRKLVAESDRDMDTLGNYIVTDVREFQGPVEQEDDMCLVCFRRLPDVAAENPPAESAGSAPVTASGEA